MSSLYPVNNLIELIEKLKSRKKKLEMKTEVNTVTYEEDTVENSFNFLQSVVGDQIRIRYEIIGKNDVPTESGNEEDHYDQSKIKKTKGRFSHLNGTTVGRVLLTTNRPRANFTSELARQCNGVVLDYASWNVISVPPPMFNPRFRLIDVVNNLHHYSIYEIKDGTTLTLYWSVARNKWCLASSNAFDVSDYKWMGPTTYFEAFASVAAKYPEFSLEKLDKNNSYTIGFHHRDFHPLPLDDPKMWLIQVCDLQKLNNEYVMSFNNYDIGIPLQYPIENENVSNKVKMQKIMKQNENALGSYLTTSRSSGPYIIHYGYILKSSTLSDHLSANSNIILESSLLKTVRGQIYNLPKKKYNEAVSITAENRLEYATLRAFLNYNTRFTFINLFPQFADKYKKYDVIFKELTNRIVSALRNRNAKDALIKSIQNRAEKTNNELVNRIDNLAFALVIHIEKTGRINVMDSQGFGIVRDFIVDRKYLDLYLTCLLTQD